jgi:hypothetical protein
MAKLFVVFPPGNGSSSLDTIYANADGATLSIPWSADNVSATLGGWETSNGGGTASAGYNYTQMDAIINRHLGYGAKSIGLILQPVTGTSPNQFTPNYVFTTNWSTAIGSPTGQLYTGSSTNYPGAGTIPNNTAAQGVDNTAFPMCFQAPFYTAWFNAVTDVLKHIKNSSYAGQIAYVRVGTSTGGEAWIYALAAMETLCTPATVVGARHAWATYRSSLENIILANKGPINVFMSLSGGATAPISVPYYFADDQASITLGNNMGISESGLQNNDILTYQNNGTNSGGSALTGFSSNDFIYNWTAGGAPTGAPAFLCQTYKASDPTYPTNSIPPRNTMGSLVPLLPFAVKLGTTYFELYYTDWQVAYDPTNANYALYSSTYINLFDQIREEVAPNTVVERDKFGATFGVGDYVAVRCLVSSITAVPSNGTGGAADLVNLTVQTPGNIGEQQGVTLVVSPTQCKKAGSTEQA